jgi:hypothetical protein
VSHLRQQISALIDGELNGAELDRANAHLASCARCRAEAATLRALKRELRELAASGTTPGQDAGAGDDELTRRLLAMAGPGGPVPSRRFRREQSRRRRREQGGGQPGGGRAAGGAGRRPHADAQQRAGRPPREPRLRGRYIAGAVSLVVVGIGAAAFSMGGATAQPGPKITPPLELFSVEHALMSGDVPLPEPTQATTARP